MQLPRIGVFGGAFDPPHLAHAALVDCAMRQLQLTQLRLLPTGHAWHKTRVLSAAQHRLVMCRLAFAAEARVVVDAREILRTGPTYTVDTLETLRQEHPGAPLFLLIGGDQAQAFRTWHRWQDIAAMATICVAQRIDNSVAAAPSLDLPTAPPDGLQRLDLAPMHISATDIRRRVRQREPLAGLVCDSVARYIEQHHLYQTL